jgi:hypothetical protein
LIRRTGADGLEQTAWSRRTGADGLEQTDWSRRTGADGLEQTDWSRRTGADGLEQTDWSRSATSERSSAERKSYARFLIEHSDQGNRAKRSAVDQRRAEEQRETQKSRAASDSHNNKPGIKPAVDSTGCSGGAGSGG